MPAFNTPFSFPAQSGVWLNQSQAFSAAISASPVGSTHYVMVDGVYNVWGTAPFVLFLTDAATDPPAVPATPPGSGNYPGALVGAGQILQFQMDGRFPTNLLAGNPTGIRVFRLTATAGTFYLSEFRTKVF
jgi:hypothetical protein